MISISYVHRQPGEASKAETGSSSIHIHIVFIR